MMIQLSQYTLLREVQRGEGYLLCSGQRNRDDAKVLLKVLTRECPSPWEIAALRHEFAITRGLDLAGVVRPYSLEQDNQRTLLVLEDPAGRPLSEAMQEGQLDLLTILQVGMALASTLGFLHEKRVIHKDIKPSNIFVRGARPMAKLYGFGIATRLSQEHQRLRAPDSLEGTLAYMSPEQTGRMNRTLDYRTDFYSLGVTLYEMLTHVLPFSTTDPLELIHSHIARRPVPPHELRPAIPAAVSNIVMKLLAKSAEDRYQSASGLEADLAACATQWQAAREIAPFLPGGHDLRCELIFPQKLYGRDAQCEALFSVWERASRGATELLLISGYSGVGKSALVREVHKAIARRGGYFVAGKFEQLMRNAVPHAAIAHAFRELIQQILTERAAALALFRERLTSALGSQGRVLIDLIPELELIIGPQPEVPELDPTETQNRFNLAFQRFLSAFPTREHPLVVFLDDLQWADPGSLKFLEFLLAAPGSGSLLLIGAYRNNEVGPGHLLNLTLGELQRANVPTTNIELAPLCFAHVVEFISDTLGSDAALTRPLAALVWRKTDGNPFFVRQFLKTVEEAGRLSFDTRSRRWIWDIKEIEEMGITDNVISLMAGKIERLSPETQRILQYAACIGHQFDLHTLSVVYEHSPSATAAALWEALREGLVLPMDSEYRFFCDPDVPGAPAPPSAENFQVSYRFLHDRVQQAAHSFIEGAKEREVQLQIGRLMLASSEGAPQGTKLFDIVSHLNLGAPLMTEASECLMLARLNLDAGKKAKVAAAYQVAAGYLRAGTSLLGEDPWQREHELCFELWIELAECESLSGSLDAVEALLVHLSLCAQSMLEQARVYLLRIIVALTLGRPVAAVALGQEALCMFGVDLPASEEARRVAVEAELAEVQVSLAGRRIADLINSQTPADPDKRAVLKLLSSLVVPSYQTSPTLLILVAVKQVNICLKHGCSDMAAYPYMIYGWVQAVIRGRSQEAEEFGRLALDINEKRGHSDLRSKLYFLFGEYSHFFLPLRSVLGYVKQAVYFGLESGDFIYASFACNHVLMDQLGLGEGLAEIRDEAERSLALMQRTKVASAVGFQTLVKQTVANLAGNTRGPGTLSDEIFDEATFLAAMESAGFSANVCYYYVLKLQLSFLYEEYAQALDMARAAEERLASALSQYFTTELQFYGCLTLLALLPAAAEGDRERYAATLCRYQDTLARWAESCPATHLHKQLLVSAEQARLDGDELAAMRLYDRAIEEARRNGFLHHEALASELCAKFHLAGGRLKIARLYLTEAYHRYSSWGAMAKLQQLLDKYPQLLSQSEARRASLGGPQPAPQDPHGVTKVPAELFDTEALMRSAQAIAGELVVEKVLERLLRLAVQNAGARRGVLVLVRNERLTLEASVTVDPDLVRIGPSVPVEGCTDIPLGIINYVYRTGEPVVLGEATSENRFAADPYIRENEPKSILCLAIVRQGRVTGLLYLENSIVADAFTKSRVELCRLLTSQAVIAVENALLVQREQSARKLAEETERRTAFLAEASMLLSGSLVLEEVLARLAQLCVGALADWCVIDALSGGVLRRIAWAHSDPAKQGLLKQLQERFAPRMLSPHPANIVLQSGQPLLIPELSDKQIRELSESDEHAELIRALGTRTVLFVPFLAHGRTIGVLSLASAAPGRRFGSVDLEQAQQLARSAAIAIENAQCYQASEEAIRLREEFLAVASHELRTPLTPLRLQLQYLQLVLHRQHLDALADHVTIPLRQVERLTALVEDMLDATRMKSGQITLHREQVDLVDVIQKVVADYCDVLRKAGCELALRVHAPVIGHWDRNRIEQVAIVLLSNAMKYGAGRSIEVDVAAEGALAKFSVRDYGIGIAPADQERIFERFERAVPTRHYGGLGLGLYIARQIVLMHRGSIRVESAPGAGTLFTVELPIDSPGPAEEGPPPSADARASSAAQLGSLSP